MDELSFDLNPLRTKLIRYETSQSVGANVGALTVLFCDMRLYRTDLVLLKRTPSPFQLGTTGSVEVLVTLQGAGAGADRRWMLPIHSVRWVQSGFAEPSGLC
jgi:hypothetical protein